MDYFVRREQTLFAEGVDLRDLAERFGTPCYVYSRATIERHWRAFDEALNGVDHLVCYAVKANANLGVLGVLGRMGAGFDIVSGGELARVLAAGGDPRKVVFSGVGKAPWEIRDALQAGIHCFNVESEPELMRLDQIAAEVGVSAPVSLRVNPDVDPKTHPYIATGLKESKFGIPIEEAEQVYGVAATLRHLEVRGVDCHIGSQLTSVVPFVDALDRVLALVGRLSAQGIDLAHIDLGGGLGIRYRDEQPPLPEDLATAVRERLAGRPLTLLLEPGRAIVGNAGVLLTRVEYLKKGPDRHFAVVDAGMNDLLRPALYDAWHAIEPVVTGAGEPLLCDVVGPVCETGDFLAKARYLSIVEGDLLAVRSAGAYGFAMSSNYNTRPRAAEIMVDGAEAHLVRPRETLRGLFSGERTLPAAG